MGRKEREEICPSALGSSEQSEGSMGTSMGWGALGVMSPLPNTKTWLEEATL